MNLSKRNTIPKLFFSLPRVRLAALRVSAVAFKLSCAKQRTNLRPRRRLCNAGVLYRRRTARVGADRHPHPQPPSLQNRQLGRDGLPSQSGTRRNRQRLRFEQWLLLARACLVLFFLGLALARPMGCSDADAGEPRRPSRRPPCHRHRQLLLDGLRVRPPRR